jgi:hypothetical protein
MARRMPTNTANELEQTKALLAELRKEREAAERALEALSAARRAGAPATPRRAEIHRALERPREPKGVLEGYDPETTQKLVYAAAAAIGVLFLIVVLLVLL